MKKIQNPDKHFVSFLILINIFPLWMCGGEIFLELLFM